MAAPTATSCRRCAQAPLRRYTNAAVICSASGGTAVGIRCGPWSITCKSCRRPRCSRHSARRHASSLPRSRGCSRSWSAARLSTRSRRRSSSLARRCEPVLSTQPSADRLSWAAEFALAVSSCCTVASRSCAEFAPRAAARRAAGIRGAVSSRGWNGAFWFCLSSCCRRRRDSRHVAGCACSSQRRDSAPLLMFAARTTGAPSRRPRFL